HAAQARRGGPAPQPQEAGADPGGGLGGALPPGRRREHRHGERRGGGGPGPPSGVVTFHAASPKGTTPEGAPVEAEDLPAKRVRATGRPLRGFLCAFTRGDGARRVLSVSAA